MLVERLFEHTDFFAPQVEDTTQSWWDQIYATGKPFIFEKLGELLEGLIVLASKLLWPFLFAAVAIPFSLPQTINERNKWIELIFTDSLGKKSLSLRRHSQAGQRFNTSSIFATNEST